MTPKQRDALAKEMGFDSFEAWKLWDAAQQRKANPNVVKKPPVKNVMQNAAPPAKKKPGHVLDYVAGKILGATKK